MEKKRVFAILNWKKTRLDNVKNEIVAKLPKLRDGDKVLVFYKQSDYKDAPLNIDGTECVPMSDQDGHNRAAGLNFVYKYLKDNCPNSYGYAIYDSIQFKKDPTEFVNSIEEMMQKLKLDVWFNTYTDPMNFVFTKFDGRVSISINVPELQAIYDKTIIWTSHSNPNVSIIDTDVFAIPEDGKTFDDAFEVPMFWIIKFLCERKRDKLGFMNYYPTIKEEIGVYKVKDFDDSFNTNAETMAKEDKMFSDFHLDHSPSMNVEELMDFIIERLKK